MALTNEHEGPMILAKIKIYLFTRAELLFQVCYETPCSETLPSQFSVLWVACKSILNRISFLFGSFSHPITIAFDAKSSIFKGSLNSSSF
jgi:hypothetical protein